MKRAALLFAAALLLLTCACTGPASPTPSPAPTATAEPAATPAPEPTAPTPTAAPTAAPTPTEPPASPAPEADRTLSAGGQEYPAYLFTANLAGANGGAADFSLVLPLEAVTADYEHNAWVFRSTAEPESWLEISFIAGGDVESLLPGLMDGYLSFTAIEFSETVTLGRVRGEVGRVSAENAGLRAEAWLLDISGGAVAAVLLMPPGSKAEVLLRAMLGTFDLIRNSH